jgi:hypothetical protein
MTKPPEDHHQGADSWESTEGDALDDRASDALEAEIAGDGMDLGDEMASTRAAEMGLVRDLLADESDGPTDAELEELLAEALAAARDRSRNPEEDRSLGSAPVPLRGGTASRERRWAAAAAAAVVVIVVGAVGLVGLDRTTDDAATGVATDDAGETGKTDAEAAPVPDDLSAGMAEDSGASLSPAGLEFTIVVPIDPR